MGPAGPDEMRISGVKIMVQSNFGKKKKMTLYSSQKNLEFRFTAFITVSILELR